MSYTYINVKSCFGTAVALVVLVVVTTTLRIALRWRAASKIMDIIWSKHLDDLFCLLALPPTIGIAIVLCYGAKKGIIGSHNEPDHIEDWITSTTPTLIILEKCVYVIFILQPLALGLIKLSFLFFYRRIFVSTGFQRTSLVFVTLTVCWMLAFFLGDIFDCRLNFAANWGSLASIAENCPFGFEATIAFTISDAAFDICILLLPLPWIMRLHMPKARKLQLCGVFMLGGFAVAAALVRMVICIKQNTPSNAVDQQFILGMPTYDIIGITSHGLFWTMVETNIALIACCLPTLRPILSMAAFGTVIASLGSFLQAVGSMLGSQKDTSYGSSGTGKFSKMSTVTIGSAKPSIKRFDRETGDSASDISLVEIEKKVAHVQVAQEVVVSHDNAFDLELDERKYLGNSVRATVV
ncbi:hypothetical protein FB567DRAFT_556105 [Paraphoma chrysanthemicola]|uniref:Rhodopsin domain-containing protein n=1 Tax=Paraphoma chrysanthemicola TaxID=798071 RepID=A0A8K0RGQ3_9PLEO|nr:hypothetical protein FB567DRAFT_556105 [Paraphoma chrysanthemicola]